MTDWMTMAAAIAAGTLSVLLALILMRFLDPVPPARGVPRRLRRVLSDTSVEPLCLLFRGRQLIDATTPAQSLMAGLPGDSDWTRLIAWLSQRFDDPQALIERARREGCAEITGGSGLGAATLRLRAEDLGQGLLRLQISDPTAENAGIVVDSHSLAAMEEELATLRDAMDRSPVMIWRETPDGRVAWANATYLREVEAQGDDEIRWPLPRLIDLSDTDGQTTLRAQMADETHEQWFDCHIQPGDEGRTIHAVPANGAVRAERSLREFVQTLTKTFADLPIGLAIFDRERRLQLFNPSLIDLTGLATGFLTARPTLYAVLDALRESRMVPEPRDYRSWRDMIATLEAAAASGHHVETWSLPGGQTYRVTGRPHPDGAIAFLFEDITSETTLTRRFRAELSLGAEILDAVDDAVAIFDADGSLLSANRAYGALWGAEHPSALRGHMELWLGDGPAGAGHEALCEALLSQELAGTQREGAMAGPDGGLLSWGVRPLSGARRMVVFGGARSAGRPTAESTPQRDRSARDRARKEPAGAA